MNAAELGSAAFGGKKGEKIARQRNFFVNGRTFKRCGYHSNALACFKRQNFIDIAVRIVVHTAHGAVRMTVDQACKGVSAAAVDDRFVFFRQKIKTERGNFSVLNADIARHYAVMPDSADVF